MQLSTNFEHVAAQPVDSADSGPGSETEPTNNLKQTNLDVDGTDDCTPSRSHHMLFLG